MNFMVYGLVCSLTGFADLLYKWVAVLPRRRWEVPIL